MIVVTAVLALSTVARDRPSAPFSGLTAARLSMRLPSPLKNRISIAHQGSNAQEPHRSHNRCLLLIVFPLSLVAFTAAVHAGGIYRWTDDHGRVHFTDKTEASEGAEQVTVRVNSYTAPPSISLLRGGTVSSGGSNRVVIYSAKWCGVCVGAPRHTSKPMISPSRNTTSRPAPKAMRTTGA